MNMKTTNTTTKNNAVQDAPAGVRKYEVSEATAAILDCIVAVSDTYDKITDALVLRYGADKADEKAEKYCAAIGTIMDYLHNEITGQVIDNMGDSRNSHSATPTI